MATLTEQSSRIKQSKEDASIPTMVIEPSSGWFSLQLDRVWQYRELLYFLVWRDIKVRYKQTALGIAWIVLQPVVSMIIYSVLFGALLKVPTGDVPYPMFAFTGLLPWNYFAQAMTRSSGSLVGNAHLVTKVYFPRLVIPLSGVLSGVIDFAVAFTVLGLLMAYYGIEPTARVVLLPAFFLLALITVLGFSLWLSALNVRYRDVQYLVPFLLQMWMYLTPVVYATTLIPEKFRWLLALNPMTGVVEGFRWALLGERVTGVQSHDVLFILSITVSVAVLITGVIFFRRVERTFADIV